MFESLKLIKPFWYFHLSGGEWSSWTDPAAFNPPVDTDTKYDSHKSAILEASKYASPETTSEIGKLFKNRHFINFK